MFKKPWILLFQLSLVFIGISAAQASEEEWAGEYRDGTVILKKDLQKILDEHGRWLKSNGMTGKQANLEFAHLEGAKLKLANLKRAKLLLVNLQKADLTLANLQEAGLGGAKLQEADLQGANLQGANLYTANLQKADLRGAGLQGAFLLEAELKGACLREASLKGSFLDKVKSFPMLYEPQPGSSPIISSMANIPGLKHLTYIDMPHGLKDLQNGFKELNYRQQEREITFALNATQRKLLMYGPDLYEKMVYEKMGGEALYKKRVDEAKRERVANMSAQDRLTNGNAVNVIRGLFQYIFFELTCGYGLSPGRSLFILIWFIPLFSVFYMISLARQKKKDGIWRILIKKRSRDGMVENNSELLRIRGIKTVWVGIYFSVLSAFSIGWRDFNTGHWLSRIQTRDYSLRATGWVRSLAGVQSLISIYLITLWVLTYFGRPFE